MFDLISIGDNCVDIYEKPKKAVYPGGNAINVSVYASREGLKVCYFGFLGDDRFGKIIMESIRKENVNIDYCRVLKGRTGYTNVGIRNGERVFIDYDAGVQKKFHLPLYLGEVLSNSKINFYSGFTSWISVSRNNNFNIKELDLDVLKKLNSISKIVAFDFSDVNNISFIKTLAPFIDIAFFSIGSAINVKHFIKKVKKFFEISSILVLTMGEKGSVGYCSGKLIDQKAIKTDVIDTLGCGDAFIGSFLAEYLKTNGDIKKSLARGTKITRQVIRKFGAW